MSGAVTSHVVLEDEACYYFDHPNFCLNRSNMSFVISLMCLSEIEVNL